MPEAATHAGGYPQGPMGEEWCFKRRGGGLLPAGFGVGPSPLPWGAGGVQMVKSKYIVLNFGVH